MRITQKNMPLWRPKDTPRCHVLFVLVKGRWLGLDFVRSLNGEACSLLYATPLPLERGRSLLGGWEGGKGLPPRETFLVEWLVAKGGGGERVRTGLV